MTANKASTPRHVQGADDAANQHELICAVKDGDGARVQAALEAGKLDLERRHDFGNTAFLTACRRGHLECAVALVEAGCNTQAKDNDEWTGLMLAAGYGHLSLIHVALNAGGDLEAREVQRGASAFQLACQAGHLGCVKALMQAGCDKRAKRNDGWTGLMLAAGYGHSSVVQAVLNAGGSDLEATDGKIGDTAFMWACQAGHAESVKALMEAGCNKNARDSNGFTGLMLAAGYGQPSVVQAVLNAGGSDLDLEAKEVKYGRTAFLMACEFGHIDCAEALIQAGSNREAKSDDGWTALMLAAQNQHQSVVQAVLNASGPDPEAQPRLAW